MAGRPGRPPLLVPRQRLRTVRDRGDADPLKRLSGAGRGAPVYGDVRIGQGRENSKEFLRQNPALADEIETIIRQRASGGEMVLPLATGVGGDDTADSGDN